MNIHIFDYPDCRLSGLFTEVSTNPDNRGSTVVTNRNFDMWPFPHRVHLMVIEFPSALLPRNVMIGSAFFESAL